MSPLLPAPLYVFFISNFAGINQRFCLLKPRSCLVFERNFFFLVAALKRGLTAAFSFATDGAPDTIFSPAGQRMSPAGLSQRASRSGSHCETRQGHPHEGGLSPAAGSGSHHPLLTLPAWPVEPDAPRGARPVRRRLALSKTTQWRGDKPGVLSDGFALNGGDRDTPL